MRRIELDTTLANGLRLKDPFWIASAQFSVTSMFTIWTDIRPAAITLKSSTRMDRNEPWKTRSPKHKTLDMLPRYGRSYYCDEPKSTDFYNYEETGQHLEAAKEQLP